MDIKLTKYEYNGFDEYILDVSYHHFAFFLSLLTCKIFFYVRLIIYSFQIKI